MQFTTPQFIDIEDKVIGPFTFKQFLYLVGGFGFAYTVFRLLPLIIGLPLALGIAGLGAALAFLKINGKPFIFTFQAFLAYTFQSKLYIWKKDPPKEKKEVAPEVQKPVSGFDSIPRLTESRLGDLSWSLDILDMNQKEQ